MKPLEKRGRLQHPTTPPAALRPRKPPLEVLRLNEGGFRIHDIFLLVTLLFISFLPLLFWGWNGNPVARAVVSVDGEEVRTIALTTHEGRESFTVETPDGWNTVTVDGHTIAVTEADCHDKICVKTGAISQKGEVIACLPHKLIIEIK